YSYLCLKIGFLHPVLCFIGDGATNIILANPQMISIPPNLNDDPYDMFNEYITDIPMNHLLDQTSEISNDIVQTVDAPNKVHSHIY
ncbi:hypothetical protein MKX03_010739, partial [Papaver bracteatum]